MYADFFAWNTEVRIRRSQLAAEGKGINRKWSFVVTFVIWKEQGNRKIVGWVDYSWYSFCREEDQEKR
jgi:hypothetical protein